jgi:hypothetical protein
MSGVQKMNRNIFKNLCLVALLIMGVIGLSSTANAQRARHRHLGHKSSGPSVADLKIQLDDQLARGLRRMNVWQDMFGMRQPDGPATALVIDNSQREFVEIGLGWLGHKANGEFSQADGEDAAHKMVAIYNAGTTFATYYNDVRGGSLANASASDYQYVIRRVTKLSDELASNDDEINVKAAVLAALPAPSSNIDGWSAAAVILKILEIFFG